MKKKILVIFALILIGFKVKSQLGISATPGYSPDLKAMLDISSTSKGLLIPRMNSMERIGITTPPASLMVYDTDLKSFWYHDATTWKEIGSGSGASLAWNLLGNLGINPAAQYIGTNDANALNFKTDNVQRIQIGKSGQVGLGADYSESTQLLVNATKEKEGIFSKLVIPYSSGTNFESFAVKGINSSENSGNKFGGYFESNGNNAAVLGDNIGVKAIANGGANINVGLFASTVNSNSYDYAAVFDKGHVRINNNLVIGTFVGLNNHLELLKQPSKTAAFFNLPIIGKNNSVIIGKRVTDNDMIALEINSENTPSGRALEVHGRSTFYDKVGINTTTVPAAYSLAVNGFIIAEELRIQNSTLWPDYVFENNYNLKSLYEVSDFIRQNKHLPDVPSAKAVENEGIVLGEMQKTLLKKIEELTLYIIDQQKQIDNLKNTVETIKNK